MSASNQRYWVPATPSPAAATLRAAVRRQLQCAASCSRLFGPGTCAALLCVRRSCCDTQFQRSLVPEVMAQAGSQGLEPLASYWFDLALLRHTLLCFSPRSCARKCSRKYGRKWNDNFGKKWNDDDDDDYYYKVC